MALRSFTAELRAQQREALGLNTQSNPTLMPHSKPNVPMAKPIFKTSSNFLPKMVTPDVYHAVQKKVEKGQQKEEQEPVPWSFHPFDSVHQYEDETDDLVDSLAADDPMVDYTCPEAIQNLRDVIRNIGELYVDYSVKK